MRLYIIYIFCTLFLITCSNKPKNIDDYPRVRKYSEWKSAKFHQDILLKIGWYPYQESSLVKTDDSDWIVKTDSIKSAGATPIIILSYPGSTKNLSLNMDIDNALLGKLIKHSLMTEIPIKKPFKEYLIEADCASCHPASKLHLIEE